MISISLFGFKRFHWMAVAMLPLSLLAAKMIFKRRCRFFACCGHCCRSTVACRRIPSHTRSVHFAGWWAKSTGRDKDTPVGPPYAVTCTERRCGSSRYLADLMGSQIDLAHAAYMCVVRGIVFVWMCFSMFVFLNYFFLGLFCFCLPVRFIFVPSSVWVRASVGSLCV